MSSSDRGRGDTPGSRHEPVSPGATPPGPAADGADPYANWLDRMQRARKSPSRGDHQELVFLVELQVNWADKMRDSWEDEDPNAKALVPGAPKVPVPRK